jgi:hypothetical protein
VWSCRRGCWFRKGSNLLRPTSSARPSWAIYSRDRRIEPRDILTVFAIADPSLPEDRTSQKALYARAGISVYWIINIPGRRVEIDTSSTGSIAALDYLHAEVYLEDREVPWILVGHDLGRTLVHQFLPPTEGQG